jgi:pyruvate/2-oxoglutarate/acetoin dehydrogenase E1 component
MSFKDAVSQAMVELAKDERVLFVGQNVSYPGHVVYETLAAIPDDRKIELPVAEDFQMGFSTGLALAGYVPVSIYPRIDFLILAANQLVNHLDKLCVMSQGKFMPKVIIRTMIGNTIPLHPGPQHSQDHTEALTLMLKHCFVWQIFSVDEVARAYQVALARPEPVLIIEPPYR